MPVKKNCFLIYLFFFTKANNKKNRVMSSEFGKLILYIWKSFPSKISAARANFLRLFSSSKRFWFSFFSFKRGVIQTSVEYLNQFLIDTHFTSIARRYQLVNSVHFFKQFSFFKFLIHSCHRRRWSTSKKVGFTWPHVTLVTRSCTELFS